MSRMNKRTLHHAWTRVRRIKLWYLLVLALISVIICIFALRSNNLKMIELRTAIYEADKNNGDIEAALRNLRTHVYGHMNTSLTSGSNAVHPPIQLKYTYERLVAARNAGATAGNDDIYNQAQKYCEQAIPDGFSGRYRTSCVESFIKQRSLGKAEPIPKNLYQFDFVSPSWSPDLAGWSLLAAVGLFLAAVTLGLYRHVLRRLIRK